MGILPLDSSQRAAVNCHRCWEGARCFVHAFSTLLYLSVLVSHIMLNSCQSSTSNALGNLLYFDPPYHHFPDPARFPSYVLYAPRRWDGVNHDHTPFIACVTSIMATLKKVAHVYCLHNTLHSHHRIQTGTGSCGSPSSVSSPLRL